MCYACYIIYILRYIMYMFPCQTQKFKIAKILKFIGHYFILNHCLFPSVRKEDNAQ